MKIFPYWVMASYSGVAPDGRERRFDAWGWSLSSEAEAKALAEERARKAFDRYAVRKGAWEGYDYLTAPLREEIIDQVREGEEMLAAITRNRYGALVLNTADVCFIDVDYPKGKAPGLLDQLTALFSKRKARAMAELRRGGRDATDARVRDWLAATGRAARLYQTAAGLRLLLTDRRYEPTSGEVAQLFEELGSDELYRRLTTHQACFRARLTPKPWRCGCRRPPGRWPRSEYDAPHFKKWLNGYERSCSKWQTCTLIDTVGGYPEDPRIATVIQVHDQFACSGKGLPLA